MTVVSRSTPKIQSLIDRQPLIVSPETTVLAAITAMTATGSSYVLVVDNSTQHSGGSPVVGILTAQALIQISTLSTPLDQLIIQAVMSQPVITLQESALTDLGNTLMLFQRHGIHHLPLMGDSNRVVGLIERGILTEILAQQVLQLPADNLNLPEQPQSTIEQTTACNDQQTETLLQASEQRYISLAATVPVGIFQTDTLGNATYVNECWCQIAGISPEVAAGTGWVQGLHPADRDLVAAEWYKAAQGRYPFQLEYRFQRPDGQVTWVYGQAAAELDANSQITGYAGTITDISDRKQAEQQLQNLIEGTAATTGQDFFPALASHMAKALNVSYALVTEKVGEELRTLAVWANGSLQSTFSYHISQTPCEKVLQYGQFHCESLVQEKFPADLELIEMGAESYLGIALHNAHGLTIGNLCILDRQPIHNPQRAESLLRVFAARAAAELDRERVAQELTHLNQDLEQRVEERTAALQASQHFIEQIANASPNILYVYDLQAERNVYVNREISTVLGYTPADIQAMGSSLFQDLMHPDDFSRIGAQYARIAAAQDGEILEFEYRMKRADGEWCWLLSRDSIFSRDLQGVVQQTIGTAQDISEQKAVLLERQEYQQRLEYSNAELLRATRLKDEFLAAMSHELRTPLNAILGMSEMLQEEVLGEVNERQKKAISTIERSGEHLLALINDILEVSKIAAGKLELDISTVSVTDLCKSSLAFVKQQAAKKQLQIITNLAPNLGSIQVDERRMRQALINLLNNAVKFTPDHGCVTLQVQRKNAECHFSIIDTGIGIAPEDQTKLFQPFVQIDGRLNRKYEGTGLGLVLVKQIVELHGGSVTLTSALDIGSCFTAIVPCESLVENIIAPLADIKPSQISTNYCETWPVNQPLILLAEDNQDNIDTLSSYLEACNYRMILAKDGQEAIDLTETYAPDIILMDIQMSGVDGLEAMRQIRQDPQLANLPIIALTALAMESDREKCLAAGANDYITKPVKLKQLRETIQHLIAATNNN